MTRKKDESSYNPILSSGVDIALPSELAEISRRQMLATGVSLTAWATASQFLGSKNAFSQTPSFVPRRNIIWISMNGGWDILEVTDPKPASTSGIDMSYTWGEARDIANSTDGSKIGRWLPNIAALGQDLLVLRGLSMGTTSHMAGSVYMDTGILSNAGRVNAASVPAIVASESQATIPIIQLNGGSEPQTDRGLLNPVSVVRAGNLELYRSMYPEGDDALQRKMAVMDYLKNSIVRMETKVGSSDRLTGLGAAESKVRGQFNANVGAKLALSEADRTLFRSGAPQGMNNGSIDAVALALKMINNDICTCINLGFGGFDTHQNQTTRLMPILTNVDFLIGKLVEGLRLSGKLDSTMIVMYSDFGRTPKVNNSNGRDHWPTGGAVVIGGGIDGGRSVGASDDNLLAADFVDPNTGKETTSSAPGAIQLNPTHLGGMVLDLTLGSTYSQYRPYLAAIPALTRLRSS